MSYLILYDENGLQLSGIFIGYMQVHSCVFRALISKHSGKGLAKVLPVRRGGGGATLSGD